MSYVIFNDISTYDVFIKYYWENFPVESKIYKSHKNPLY